MNSFKPNLYSLPEKQIIDMPESSYMNAMQLSFFKSRLLALYVATQDRIEEARKQIALPMGSSDENDRASFEEQVIVALRIVDREQKLLPKIQQSLKRIRTGTYGYCLESDEPIGIPRLLARPTAEYCAEVKAIIEIQEKHYNG